MFALTMPHASTAVLRRAHTPAVGLGELDEAAAHMRRVADMLALVADAFPVQRRLVHVGDAVYQSGQTFSHLYVLNSGFVKMVNLSADGRDQIVSLKFRGDWLGFDGIADAMHDCDAITMDTGEVWAIPYDALLTACAARPRLMAALHSAMSREITRDRESLMSVCTLSADARVADFLHYWADSLGKRGQRTDQITLRMTRAEIGNYLGLTLESVSRALSKLVREQVVGLKFRGDWLGVDGIARGAYACDAVAMDTGEVWAIPYAALLASCVQQPALLTALHEAMSREITRDRESLMSVCTLPADARVADFLHYWADSLGKRGQRTDQITLRMTRAEIGNYLGLTLESVSRALSKLARENLIAFTEKGRREVRIPDLGALAGFVQRCLAPAGVLQ